MKVLRKNGEIVEAGFEEQEGKKAFWHYVVLGWKYRIPDSEPVLVYEPI